MSKRPMADPEDPAGGNTKPPAKKQCAPAKKWCFTWNNYPSDWKSVVDPKIQKIKGSKFGIGKEVGESGTPHLQGWVEFGTKIRPLSLGLPSQIHWEKMRGTIEDSVTYCSKDGEYYTNVKVQRPLPTIELYGWQLDCKDVAATDPTQRDIHWYWSKDGGRGKSSMVRWLAMEGALVCAGKASDMKYQIIKYKEKNDVFPDIVVFDCPRSMQNYLSYTGIEEIKNGVFASSKYESDMVIMPWPHVFVFANFPPDLTDKDMSHDRFVVTNVDAASGILQWHAPGMDGYDPYAINN